jgi:hypothetical protein
LFPVEAEKFSPEKSVKDRAYLPQALVIMAWLDQTPTKLRTVHSIAAAIALNLAPSFLW